VAGKDAQENRVVAAKNGQKAILSLSQAKSFEVYNQEEISLSTGDSVRITKNFQCGAARFTNNEIAKIASIDGNAITLADGRVIKATDALHFDQGFAVTSHASQGKTVDQVIVSVPVSVFSQANEVQFYVSMSRARVAMHLYTDSRPALKEAVMRPSRRLSPSELVGETVGGGNGVGKVNTPVRTQEKAVLRGNNWVGRREVQKPRGVVTREHQEVIR
jgi:ATP-dependent exoDNAse (exonuclease V) alpha subunit